MKFYYVYKITNLINNKFYIGKHSCDTLNNNYMGSGKIIKRAINKYGVENFKKEILFVFDTEEEALLKEKDLLTLNVINNPNCYNLTEGGKGSFFHINNNKELQQKSIESLKDFYKKNPLARLESSKKQKEWVKNNPDKVIEINKKATKTRLNKSKEEKEIIKLKKQNTFKDKSILEEEIKRRKEISRKYKELYNSEEGVIIKNKISNSVLKSSFRDCYYNEFEIIKDDVLFFICNTNLPDKDIKILLNIPFRITTLLKYYQKKGYVKNINITKINDVSHTVIVNKTVCDLDNFILKENKVIYKYLRIDYIELFLKYQNYFFGKYSDSYIYNFLKFKNWKNVLKYLSYLNIINIENTSEIDISNLYENTKQKKALKTFISFNKDFKQTYKLIIKGEPYEYKISSSYNGESFSIVWRRL